jgi:bone morphogenetic protein receptor type-2
VWKGLVNEQPVAVKIFSANKKQYFLNEKDIYNQPFMSSCPALLTYFGKKTPKILTNPADYRTRLQVPTSD